MKINGESHGLRLAGPCHSFQTPCLVPSCQNCTPLLCRLLSPGHTYCRLLPFPTRPSIPVLAVPSFSDANTMSNRIHPSDASRGGRARRAAPAPADRRPAVYTVWKRSSMGFQGTDGFCVYDDAGRLAFRVDNYSRRRKLSAGELLLMDGQGTPLLSLRPQVITLPFLKHRCSFSSLLISSFLEATYKVIAKVSNLLISNP